MILTQTLILAAILAVLVLILRKPSTVSVQIDHAAIAKTVTDAVLSARPTQAQAAPVIRKTYTPAAGGPTLWEVCNKPRGEMIHTGFVREGTRAYQTAFDTPGVYLRNGEIITEGVQ